MDRQRDIWDQIEMATQPGSLDEEIFELISAYADGECSSKERRLVEAYLQENPRAREVLGELRAQAALFQEQAEEPPAWLRDAVLSRTTRRPALRVLGGPPARAGAVVAAAAAVWLGVVLWPGDGQSPGNDLVAVIEPSAASAAGGSDRTSPATTGIPAPVAGSIEDAVSSPRGSGRAAVGGPANRGRAATSTRAAESEEAGGLDVSAGSGREAGAPIEFPPPEDGAPPVEMMINESPARAYFGPSFGPTPKAAPSAPDVVALAGGAEAGEGGAGNETTAGETGGAGDGSPVSGEARERLRERLRQMNRGRNDVQEAVRWRKSDREIPSKDSGQDGG
ncbi:MAG: hypothetical protein IH851_13345 [Armatimonadetes bacterium]|nr:hypothetical protein [Armatimonadota bacterium]